MRSHSRSSAKSLLVSNATKSAACIASV
jgi:hypothetical protein